MGTFLEVRDPNFRKRRPTSKRANRKIDLDAEPSPVIMAKGIRSAAVGRHRIVSDPGKPPYRVPLMAELPRVKRCGLKVVTTFAGCGGSSLGYRMAGFDVVYANEFVPLALECYRLNAAPGTVLDGRDIRGVDPRDILHKIGLKRGELDLLDGSPPCQAFSTAGRREKGWGEEREYEHGAKQRNEDLFFEFVRILRGLKPKAFIAENVAGLVRGVAKGYFLEILRQLRASGYVVEARLVDAQWLGVPQQRQRVIFVGVRRDLGLKPAFPLPLAHRYSVRDAIPWIVGARTAEHGWTRADQLSPDKVAPTVPGAPGKTDYQGHEVEAEIIYRGQTSGRRFAERRRSIDKPSAAVTKDGYGAARRHQYEIIGNKNAPHGRKNKRFSVGSRAPTVMSRRVNLEVQPIGKITQGPEVDFRNEGRELDPDAPLPGVAAGDGGRRTPRQFTVERVVQGPQGDFRNEGMDVTDRPSPAILASQPLGVVVERRVMHDTGRGDRKDITDRPSPTITAGPKARAGGGPRNHFQVEAAPEDISRFAIGDEARRLGPGQQSGRFFSLARAHSEHPSPTVTAKGGNSSTAGVIHPTERRKFTIEELRRICAFPDDFALVGTYAQQWERLGNSVPPLMMRAIAEAVRDKILLPAKKRRS